MNKTARILIIDDEDAIRDSCTQVLSREGYQVDTAADGREGLKKFRQHRADAVLLDLKLPGWHGMKVLQKINQAAPEIPVIIITGFASIESAVDTIKRGAFDYLAKPFSPEELRVMLEKALAGKKPETSPQTGAGEEFEEFDMVVGRSREMAKVVDLVKRVSATESTVLITGESGTGKELLAREIHKHSLRRNAPFVVVDCGALVETLFESELFGHVKGSFTGAHETKHGRFEVANGGTIFLDEISNIGMNIQAKLLRVIQEREVTRIGSNQPIKVDVRILAATNVSLTECVRKGEFREDLFYRLSVVPLHIPPLRDRKQDIPPLVEHFLEKYNRKAMKRIHSLSSDAMNALMEYDWPGNIRELENTTERAVVLSTSDEIKLKDLIYHGIGSDQSFLPPADGQFKSLKKVEKDYIQSALRAQNFNKSKTARILKIDRKTLYSKIKKYKIKSE